jgi:predicted Rossmann fold nucleotide-binding protein DprA/Smf involved in DNA uptake
MSDSKYYLALDRAPGIGPASMREIHESLTRTGIKLSDLFACPDAEIRNEFVFSEAIYKGISSAKDMLDAADEEYCRIVGAGLRIVLFFEKAYPPLLAERLGNALPPVLYMLGDPAIASTPCAALLGHADTSEKGTLIIHQAARECVRHGITVVGGLSKGAGSAAHATAIEHGGMTIGVLPCGFFTFELSARLSQLYDPSRFLIISTFPPEDEYSQFRAMERNRYIAALSRAVCVVETPAEGGLVEAAKSARKLSVPLYTVQYAEYPPSAAGNDLLIKEYGAHPVRGRREGESIIPNIDALIASVKFGGKS